MKNKYLGISIAALGVILLILILSIVPVIKSVADSECSCSAEGDICPHEHQIPGQIYIGVGAVFVLFYISYSIITKKDGGAAKKIEIPKDLPEDEKKIIDEIIKSEGVIFQSELVEKLGISKVKITRLLDKLEARKLVERRRRGMTNAVILK